MQFRPRSFLKVFLLSIPAVFFFFKTCAADSAPLFFAFSCSGNSCKTVSEKAISFTGKSSWYSSECCKYNPVKSCPMANGQSLYAAEKQGIDFAASWHYPLNSLVKVTNLSNGKSVIVLITDRGPAKHLRRVIDISKKSFQKISNLKTGLINVNTEALI